MDNSCANIIKKMPVPHKKIALVWHDKPETLVSTRNYYWTILDPLSLRQVASTNRKTEVGPSCLKDKKQTKIYSVNQPNYAS